MKAFRGGILSLLAIVFVLPVVGQETRWTGNAAGDFGDSVNWTEGVPDSTTQARFLTGASFTTASAGNFSGTDITTYNVTVSGDDSAYQILLRGQGSAPAGTTGGGDGIINLTVNSGESLTIAGAGSTAYTSTDFYVSNGATVNLNGAGSVIVQSGLIAIGDTAAGLTVGYGGTQTKETGVGTLNLSAGIMNVYASGSGSTLMAVGLGAGSVGVANQSGTSTMTANTILVGADTGTGTYNLAGGTFSAAEATFGNEASSTGTFNQTGGSATISNSLVLGEVGTGAYNLSAGSAMIQSLTLGEDDGGSGTVTQTGGTLIAGSVDISASTDSTATTGTYSLSGGSATFGSLIVGSGPGSSGNLVQSGGMLEVDENSDVGLLGTGTFTLSGGTALFDRELTAGGTSGTTGTITQSGGNLTVTGALNLGLSGTGTYSMSGGTADFEGGITIGENSGSTGTFTQTGGTVTIASGQTLALNQSTSTYDLNDGTLLVSDNVNRSPNVNAIDGTGTFNFGGGTLEANGTSLTDTLAGTVTGASTVNAPTAGTTVTLEGDLSGTGSMKFEGDSTAIFDLTGTNSYSGGTTVSDGTVNATTSSLPGAGPLSIASGATVKLTGSSEFVHTGSLTGAGTLNFGSFTFEQAGTPDFTGTVDVGASGTLQVFSGTLGTVAGAGGNLTVGGDSTVATSGTVTLDNPGTYTGTTTINSGFTLLANTSLQTSAVTNTGSFGNGGAVGNITLGSGGTGSLTQPQEATTAAEGTLLVRVTGNVADSFTATTADLYGKVGYSGYSAIGTTSYRIFTATGGMTTGTLNSSTAAGLAAVPVTPSSLLSATLSFSSAAAVTTPTTGQDNLYLVVTQLPISQFALTPNQVAVANALDAALGSPSANNSIFAAIDTISTGSIPGALDQLSPRSYLYMRDLAFENSTFLAQGINDRLAGVRAGFSGLDTSGLSLVTPGLESSLGRSLGSMLAYNSQGTAPNGVNYYPEDPSSQPPYQPATSTDSLTSGPAETRTISDSPDYGMTPTPAPMPRASGFNAPNFSEFVSGDLVLADLSQKSSNNIPDAHATAADATAGVAFKITPHLAVGALFDYNHSDAKTDSAGSHVRADSYSPGLYGTFFDGGFYVNGLFTYGFNNYSNDRVINLGAGNSTATSSPRGEQYSGALDFGYDFHPTRDPHWTAGPDIGLQYTHLNVDSFTESGAGLADLAVSSQDADSLRGRLGGHLLYQVRSASIVFAPNIFAAYQHEFLDDTFGLTSQFDIPGTTAFTIQGTHPGRDSALVGLGVSATFDNDLALYLDYIAQVGADDYLVQSVQGGLKASF